MFSFLGKGPRFKNQEFSDLSWMLTVDDENPTFRRYLLKKEKLDFSLESLREIDRYLDELHVEPPSGNDFFRVALRCGAYVGEVMRKVAPNTFNWVSYEEAAKHSETVASFEMSLPTVSVLWK